MQFLRLLLWVCARTVPYSHQPSFKAKYPAEHGGSYGRILHFGKTLVELGIVTQYSSGSDDCALLPPLLSHAIAHLKPGFEMGNPWS